MLVDREDVVQVAAARALVKVANFGDVPYLRKNYSHNLLIALRGNVGTCRLH